MTRGTERFIAALAYLAMAVAIFGRSFPSDKLYVSMHTQRLEPWRSAITPEHDVDLGSHEFDDASDKLISFRADDQFTMEALRAGRLPLWNPSNAGGVPHLAQGLYGVFYPFHWVYRWIDPERAYGFLAALHCALAAFFTFLYVRSLGVGFSGSLLAGVAFGFSGCMIARAHYYQYIETIAWLPLGMLLVDRWFDGSKRAAFGLSIVTALVLLVGWPQLAVFSIYTWGLALICRSVGTELKVPIARALGLVLVTGAVAAGASLVVPDALVVLAFWPYLAALLVLVSSSGRAAFVARLARFAGFIALGGAIAACQYLPAAGWMGEGVRDLTTPEVLQSKGLFPRVALGWIVDGLFGMPGFPLLHGDRSLTEVWLLSARDALTQWSSRTNLIESAGYVGLLTLPLALFGCAARGRRRAVLLVAGFLFLGFALGKSAFVYPLYFLPGFQLGSDPRRGLLVVAFVVAALAGLGLDVLLNGAARRPVRAIATLLAVLGVGAWITTQVLTDAALIGPFVDHARAIAAELGADYPVSPQVEALNAAFVRDVLARFALVAILSGAALTALTFRVPMFVRAAAPIVALAIDLGLAALPRTEPMPRAEFLGDAPLIDHLQQTVGTSGRIAHWSTVLSLPEIVFSPNLPGCYGLLDAWCYTVSPSKRWFELANRIPGVTASGSLITPLNDVAQLSSRVLDLMAVKAIVGKGPVPSPLPPGITLDAQFGECWVLKNERALPRAFTVAMPEHGGLDRLLDPSFDPRRSACSESLPLDFDRTPIRHAPAAAARVLAPTPESTVVSLDGAADPGFLVLLDGFAPGWTASIDGVPAEVLRVDHAFRGLFYPAGAKSIEFRYEPKAVRLGLIVSAAALLAALLGLALASVPRRTGSSAAPLPRA